MKPLLVKHPCALERGTGTCARIYVSLDIPQEESDIDRQVTCTSKPPLEFSTDKLKVPACQAVENSTENDTCMVVFTWKRRMMVQIRPRVRRWFPSTMSWEPTFSRWTLCSFRNWRALSTFSRQWMRIRPRVGLGYRETERFMLYTFEIKTLIVWVPHRISFLTIQHIGDVSLNLTVNAHKKKEKHNNLWSKRLQKWKSETCRYNWSSHLSSSVKWRRKQHVSTQQQAPPRSVCLSV